MKDNIVLITRENAERVTLISVYLCQHNREAKLFCQFVNRLSLDGGEKLVAREITMNREYTLEKYVPLGFDEIILSISSRNLQKGMRELDSSILAVALKSASEEVKTHFFRNMSKRAAGMLKEDMEYMDPVSESEIEDIKQHILDIYHCLTTETYDKSIAAYENLKKKGKKGKANCENPNEHIVLVFRGTGSIAEKVSVSLFDTYESACNFCDFLNELKTDKDVFVYARHAEQMLEYETKPLFVRFDQILEYKKRFGEYSTIRIIRETLKEFSLNTLLKALKGLDKRTREVIIQCLPTKTADEINQTTESPDENRFYISTWSETRQARLKIINAINRNVLKFEKHEGKFKDGHMVKC